jgi:hypothetical protein
MEKIELTEEALKMMGITLIVGDWSAKCNGRTFKINNHGIKLWARNDEELEQIVFDLDKKTVSVKVKNPTLPTQVPRTVDLSGATDFFEELRNNIEMLLTEGTGTFKAVVPNDDRTVFEISHEE